MRTRRPNENETRTPRWLPVLVFAVALLRPAPAGADDPPPAPAPPAGAPAADVEDPPPPAVEVEVEEEPPLLFENEVTIVRAGGTVVYVYTTNFAEPADVIQGLVLLGVVSKDPKSPGLVGATIVPKRNQILIEGEPEMVQIALDAIAYFDLAQPQVFIEAKVVEVTHDSNFEFGVDYVWDRDVAGPNTIFRGAEGVLNPPSYLRSLFPPGFPFQGTSVDLGFVGKNADRYGAFGATVQALDFRGKAEVLSKPSIIATQGQKATVTTTEQVPVLALSNATRTNETFNQSSIKTGVKMEVTPLHIGEGFVQLDLVPSVDGIQGLATSRVGGTFTPIATSRSVNTRVTLADGETLVIGGLYTNNRVIEKARTPLLSDVPVLGELFTRTRESKQKAEIVFILTPHIVRKTAELKIVVPPAELERLERVGEEEPSTCATCGREGCEGTPFPLPPKPGAKFMED